MGGVGSLDEALREATRRLAAAGVPSPNADAVALAAHLLDSTYGDVRRAAVLGAPAPCGYAELVARRAERVPLQHLTGVAHFRRLTLRVGPGVFVPRPETEMLVEGVLAELHRGGVPAAPPLVVDLCTGSGAIALAIADEVPGAVVWAVEAAPEAARYARANIAALCPGVRFLEGDAAAPLAELPELAPLAGRVDVVTCNPPYIPDGMMPIDPEVRDHDPAMALFGLSPDGLAVPRRMAARAAELLRPGGLLAMEHGQEQGRSLPEALAAQGWWRDVRDEPDLAGRPRVTLAWRAEAPETTAPGAERAGPTRR